MTIQGCPGIVADARLGSERTRGGGVLTWIRRSVGEWLGRDRPWNRRLEQKAPAHMMPTEKTFTDRRRRQARNVVLLAMVIAFFGALLGVVFGIALGAVTGPEVWIIGICAIVTGSMIILVHFKPWMATSEIGRASCRERG